MIWTAKKPIGIRQQGLAFALVVILAAGMLPGGFLLAHGEAVYSGVPIVFCDVDSSKLWFSISSIWDFQQWHILGGVTLILVQTALVAGLLVSRARFRRAEMAWQESEQRRQRAEDEADRQRDELAHALRAATLGELTASLSHELGQPLTAIIVNARAARRLIAAGQAKEDVEEALDDVVAEANRASEIIGRLRALFRKQPAVRAPVNVNDVIGDVLRLLATNIRSRKILLHFKCGERLPAVLGDGVQLRQVLINLLVNAGDAIALTSDGPREIRIETSQPNPRCVTIAIRDSGVGLAESDLERIFEHFVSTKPQGLGMGLTISRSIVEAHEGRLWATRNDGRGLTLHVELPAAPAEPLERSSHRWSRRSAALHTG